MQGVDTKRTTIKTVRQLAEDSDGLFSVQSLRYHIFHAATNGLLASGALLRIGRRVLVDEPRFYEWLESHRVK